jgi:hypothetical protein
MVSTNFIIDNGISDQAATCMTMIHAGVTKRIILYVKKIIIPKELTDKPIPTPAWKQFIASQNSVLGETKRRALFWYREALIGGLGTQGRILANWSCVKIF